MSKLILNGTNGITAYEADNTTVLSTKSLSELNTIKPIVFRSSSSLVISGKMTGDASLTPPVLRYSDENSTELVGVAFEHVATNTESFTEPDSTHTLPTGIQAGDLIVICLNRQLCQVLKDMELTSKRHQAGHQAWAVISTLGITGQAITK